MVTLAQAMLIEPDNSHLHVVHVTVAAPVSAAPSLACNLNLITQFYGLICQCFKVGLSALLFF